MTPIKNCIVNKDTTKNPIWLMRQAGRYLPEFREIRKKNQDFIKLCLDENLSSEITLQPIKRFGFDAAIIFSDILMLPYAINQEVKFEKGFGPKLGDLNIDKIEQIKEADFTKKLKNVYKAILQTSKSNLLENRDLIGFVGAPWTILVYMINRVSPKNGLSDKFFEDKLLINNLLQIIEKFLKLHIKNQIEAGANIIQIFDSWAGLLENKIPEYIYNPTSNIVDYAKEMGVPIICFPRGIKDYKKYCDIVKPDAINIDYEIDIKKIIKDIKIPIQGGLDPKILLTDKANLRKEVKKYLTTFNDHPYIFNLGHGILPDTKIDLVKELINIVRNYK
tara:strand:+ start:2453 stop:3454 length:1002 start_codon:yes stop_codon:yes gene_type:complete